jgi:hypothetical protein
MPAQAGIHDFVPHHPPNRRSRCKETRHDLYLPKAAKRITFKT